MRELTYRRKKRRGIAAAFLFFILILSVAVVFGLFRVQKLEIVGNEHYTDEQIQEAVMQDGLCKNSLYLLWKYENQDKVQEDLPFLSGAEVKLQKPYQVQITVFEKVQIGYFVNQGNYVYFDRDGMVVEMSEQLHEGVPQITGLDVEKAVLYEKLPVADESLYNTIVTLTKALNKNNIVPEEIRFGTRNTITLVFDQISVNLGDDSALEDKISALGSILAQLEGRSGILNMEGYAENNGTVTFKNSDENSDKNPDAQEDNKQSQMDPGGSETSSTQESDQQESVQSQDSKEEDFWQVWDGEEPGDSQTPQSGETDVWQPWDGEEPGDSQTPQSGETDVWQSWDGTQTGTYQTPDGSQPQTPDQSGEYLYTDENGGIITDGYGYIDPYTGAYILGSP